MASIHDVSMIESYVHPYYGPTFLDTEIMGLHDLEGSCRHDLQLKSAIGRLLASLQSLACFFGQLPSVLRIVIVSYSG